MISVRVLLLHRVVVGDHDQFPRNANIKIFETAEAAYFKRYLKKLWDTTLLEKFSISSIYNELTTTLSDGQILAIFSSVIFQ